jgi:hypothetical protein
MKTAFKIAAILSAASCSQTFSNDGGLYNKLLSHEQFDD